MSSRTRRLGLRLGRHYADRAHDRRTRALRFWEFTHASGIELPAHTHERAHVLVVLEGSFLETSGTEERHIVAGSSLLYPRGARHRNRIGPNGARTLAVEFDDDYLIRKWPAQLDRLGSTIVSTAKEVAATARLLQRQLRACASPPATHRTVERLVSLLLENNALRPAWVDEVKKHLGRDDACLRDIARRIGRHPAHIMREFRRCEGITPGEYRRALRIARACELLRRTPQPLAEIALACGFSDQSHLTRTFKRFVNMTPAAYRDA